MLRAILTIVVATCTILFVGFYFAYYLFCVASLRLNRLIAASKPGEDSTPNLPTVSMIIPVYNEAAVIVQKIGNIEKTNYPSNKLEVLFVDGGSTDGTADLIERECKSIVSSVRVLRQGSRRGFNSAIVEGFPETSGDVICIPGAETEYHPDALHLLVTHFRDQQVGVVTGRQQIKNWAAGIAPSLEMSYRNLYDFIRASESRIDTPFDLKGEISVCRRVICTDLVARPSFAAKGCIDTCLSFQARIAGYKTVYEPSAVYYEQVASSFRDSFKQRVRRAATLIQNMMIFKSMILNRRYGAFGLIIMPAHFLMLVVLPFFLVFDVVGLFGLVIVQPSNLALMALLVVAMAVTLLVRELQAFWVTQVALVVALLRMVTGIETQKFERLRSTR